MPNKDWTGNSKSVYTTLGASNHTDEEREEDDYYATDPIAIDVLINDGHVTFDKNIWECACGEGHLSERLKAYGYNVRSSDLRDRGYGESGVDFLQSNEIWNGDIVTNPPFSFAKQFIKHALDILPDGKRAFMFLKVQFLEGTGRYKLFTETPPKCIYVSSSRIMCAKNAAFEELKKKGGSAIAYAWYEWEKGYQGDAIVKWINYQERKKKKKHKE